VEVALPEREQTEEMAQTRVVETVVQEVPQMEAVQEAQEEPDKMLALEGVLLMPVTGLVLAVAVAVVPENVEVELREPVVMARVAVVILVEAVEAEVLMARQ
jgi:hypothetical protein